MRTIGVIPARFAATRFMGKVLADLGGKPVIQHVWENARQARTLDDLIIAADDERIIKAAEAFGAKAVFTSPDQPTGTDRLLEVVNPLDVDIIVNIQGDEPMVKPIMIDSLTRELQDNKGVSMATLAKLIEDKDEIEDPNVVKVVIDRNGYALYFSRSIIPYPRYSEKAKYYKHLGIYAYTKDFLFEFANLGKAGLEETEGLEQLRVLAHSRRIKVVETNIDTIGIDTPADLERAKVALGFEDAVPVENDGTSLENERNEEPKNECEGPCAASRCEAEPDGIGKSVEGASECQDEDQAASDDKLEIIRDEWDGGI